MFLVRLDHAILYPECINTKTRTASCMRWEQNHIENTKAIQNWTGDFVKLIVDNHCMPNTSYGALRKPCGRSTSVFCSVQSRVAALDFGMSDMWFVIAVL